MVLRMTRAGGRGVGTAGIMIIQVHDGVFQGQAGVLATWLGSKCVVIEGWAQAESFASPVEADAAARSSLPSPALLVMGLTVTIPQAAYRRTPNNVDISRRQADHSPPSHSRGLSTGQYAQALPGTTEPAVSGFAALSEPFLSRRCQFA
jgi:hypothetical protein